ncbi:MAG: hypothetical protein ABIQ18_01500, partial [Umezawaea sp.]
IRVRIEVLLGCSDVQSSLRRTGAAEIDTSRQERLSDVMIMPHRTVDQPDGIIGTCSSRSGTRSPSCERTQQLP